MIPPDSELLARFVRHEDEASFKLLVERHWGLVHAAACRITRGSHLAEEVAQQAFIRLARHAKSIPPAISLPTWLHRTTRSLAIDLVRSEERRRKRENEAIQAIHMNTNSDLDSLWVQMSPEIDHLVSRLSAKERDVILLRFYCGKSHKEAAQALGLTEQAVKQRVSRAIERLRSMLQRQGIATTTAALASLLSACENAALPPLSTASTLASEAIVAKNTAGMLTDLLCMTLYSKSIVAGAVVLLLVSLCLTRLPPPFYSSSSPKVLKYPAAGLQSDELGIPRNSPRQRVLKSEPSISLRNRLEDLLYIVDPLERRDALARFMTRLNAGDFPELESTLTRRLADDRDNFKYEQSLFVSAWILADPPAAASYEMNTPGDLHGIAEWIKRDKDGCVEWALQYDDEGGLSRCLWVAEEIGPGESRKLAGQLLSDSVRWHESGGVVRGEAKRTVLANYIQVYDEMKTGVRKRNGSNDDK